MISDTKIYLAYLLDEEAKAAEDPSSEYFLKLMAKYIRQEVGITQMATTYMHPGYKNIEVSLVEINR